MRSGTVSTPEFKKLHLEEMVLFAINNVPEIDPATLERFMELVNAGGNFGTISQQQILQKMHQILKYIPNACGQSFLILMDLLDIKPFSQLALTSSQADGFKKDVDEPKAGFLIMETGYLNHTTQLRSNSQ